MNLQKVGSHEIVCPTYKSVRMPLDRGVTFRAEFDGNVTAEIEVLVDVRALVEALGRKAFRSKSGKSKIQNGAVTLVCRSTRKVNA